MFLRRNVDTEQLKSENEALRAEVQRLRFEVVNRNKRALEGDELRKSADSTHDYYEKRLATEKKKVFQLEKQHENFNAKAKEIITYCEPHKNFMWAAQILAILIDTESGDPK